MIAAIILAGGKGTRAKSKEKNKVTLPFLNKPLIIYAVELMATVASPVVVVVGAFAESIKEVLKKYFVTYAYQKKRLGTAHATRIGLEELEKITPLPKMVLVCYGDHTMFYKKETVKKLIDIHQQNNAAVSLITTVFDEPEKLRWGRIVRDGNNNIINNIEEIDADEEIKNIKEVNAGFYCFDYKFLRENISKVKKSTVSGEYYINYLVKIAVGQKKTIGSLLIPFDNVGIGINTINELKESEKIYLKKNGI
jgi:bifunctional UDP-N-acetylglucosamine pyrophosphorylase/glucosamine-1-phosphate N-acetyltransferase